jgi:hypothetical protein
MRRRQHLGWACLPLLFPPTVESRQSGLYPPGSQVPVLSLRYFTSTRKSAASTGWQSVSTSADKRAAFIGPGSARDIGALT